MKPTLVLAQYLVIKLIKYDLLISRTASVIKKILKLNQTKSRKNRNSMCKILR